MIISSGEIASIVKTKNWKKLRKLVSPCNQNKCEKHGGYFGHIDHRCTKSFGFAQAALTGLQILGTIKNKELEDRVEILKQIILRLNRG